MNKEKMTRLALFMEDLEKERFSIGYWISESYINRMGNADFCEGSILDINLCGTAGCIAGWALALENNGKFAAFEYDEDYDDHRNYCGYCDEHHYDGVCPAGYVSTPVGQIQYDAADVLGLTKQQADRLFIPDANSVWNDYQEEYGYESYNYSTYYPDIHPKHVADMLYRIVNGEVKL